jgi:hypothetical protein
VTSEQSRLQSLLLITPERTYRGEEALQEFERRRHLRHADLPAQIGGEVC